MFRKCNNCWLILGVCFTKQKFLGRNCSSKRMRKFVLSSHSGPYLLNSVNGCIECFKILSSQKISGCTASVKICSNTPFVVWSDSIKYKLLNVWIKWKSFLIRINNFKLNKILNHVYVILNILMIYTMVRKLAIV